MCVRVCACVCVCVKAYSDELLRTKRCVCVCVCVCVKAYSDELLRTERCVCVCVIQQYRHTHQHRVSVCVHGLKLR